MAEHASELSDYLMKNLGLSQYECDELWSFVKKKKRRLNELTRLSLSAATTTSTPHKTQIILVCRFFRWQMDTTDMSIWCVSLLKPLKYFRCSALWKCSLMG